MQGAKFVEREILCTTYRLLIITLLLLTACAGNRPATPVLPTYDAREIDILCNELNTAWNHNWPDVLDVLGKLRDRHDQCGAQDPALQLYPAYYNYGAWLEAHGDPNSAISAYRSALVISPQGTEAILALKRLNVFTPVPRLECTAQQVQDALAAVPPYSPLDQAAFVQIQAGEFTGEGQPFPVRGINYYPARAPWHRFLLEADPSDVAKELDLIRATGFNTLRLFLWYDALFRCPGSGVVPVPGVFARFDAIIKLAAERGFRLIVTLNDLPDLLSYPLYTESDIPAAQTAYIVQRYRDEPAIMAWDVRNEGDIDYTRNGFSSALVLNWLEQTVTQIRQIDSRHLITAGWNENSQATERFVDFLSLHHWRDSQNLDQRLAALRGYTDKPILLEETGFSTFGLSEAKQSANLADVLSTAEKGGLAGWLIWTAFDYAPGTTCIPPACPDVDNAEHHFGLWHADYSPKPAVAMVKARLIP